VTRVQLANVYAAAERLQALTRVTPLLPWRTRTTLVKAECLQVSGSFKARGAFNATLLAAGRGACGVLAWSSGNHGRAVATAASAAGLTCVVLMPDDAPAVKLDAVRELGAEVVPYDRRADDREHIGHALAEQRGLEVIPSSGHPDVIAGQATVCLEVLSQCSLPVRRLIVPVGGGGLLAGCAVVLQALSPSTQLVAVEPEASPDFHLGQTLQQHVARSPGQSLADGLLLPAVSDLAYLHARGAVHGAVLCSEADLRRTVAEVSTELNLVVEGAGAASLTQLFRSPATDGATVAVATGGNIAPPRWPMSSSSRRASSPPGARRRPR
jgi:threo-3-hydroxy-L-aspartate ammonia-lyase